MKKQLFCIAALLISTCSFAQKINLEKWVKINIDSLHKIGVDTAIYYHDYCGNCMILAKPFKDTVHTRVKRHQCEIENSWTEIDNVIIYQQNGLFFSLTFDCSYPPIKKALSACNSIRYATSLIPILNRRDSYLSSSVKKGKFLLPIVADGGYEAAEIYLKNIHQHIYMQENQKTDKQWRAQFWIDKQTQLLLLLRADIFNEN